MSVSKRHGILFKAASKTILHEKAMQRWLLQLTDMMALKKLLYSLRYGVPGIDVHLDPPAKLKTDGYASAGQTNSWIRLIWEM